MVLHRGPSQEAAQAYHSVHPPGGLTASQAASATSNPRSDSIKDRIWVPTWITKRCGSSLPTSSFPLIRAHQGWYPIAFMCGDLGPPQLGPRHRGTGRRASGRNTIRS